MLKMIDKELNAHKKVTEDTIENLQSYIYTACMLCVDTLKSKGKILVFGNGGSAADAQHFAAEITGRYKSERRGLPAIALTTDTSAITAIGNDYGYDKVFERQVEALAYSGDLLIGISTSGNSKNVIEALKLGKQLGCRTIGLSGRDGGEMDKICNLNIVVPSSDTPRIQEIHILIIHILAQAIDDAY